MAENVYEGLFILDSNAYFRDAAGVSNQVNAMLTKHGGEILTSRLWEERRLAYPIKGHRKGTYWLAYFKIASDKLTAIRRDCDLNESMLRSMVLKVDPRLVDSLVSHAKGGPPPRPTPAMPPAGMQMGGGRGGRGAPVMEEIPDLNS